MKHTGFMAKAIILLGTLLLATIDCFLAPFNAGSILVGMTQWVNRLWLPFVAAWREF
jgi:hypothetical protein